MQEYHGSWILHVTSATTSRASAVATTLSIKYEPPILLRAALATAMPSAEPLPRMTSARKLAPTAPDTRANTGSSCERLFPNTLVMSSMLIRGVLLVFPVVSSVPMFAISARTVPICVNDAVGSFSRTSSFCFPLSMRSSNSRPDTPWLTSPCLAISKLQDQLLRVST